MAIERRRSGLLTGGGVLTIIGGASGIILGILYAALGTAVIDASGVSSSDTGVILALGIISIILGAIALYGGINALRVKSWGWALAGAICALICPLSFGIFGLLGIIFIACRKRDFA